MAQNFTEDLKQYTSSIEKEFPKIRDSRAETLGLIAKYISDSKARNGISKVLFVCTHNSRRSQLAQIWMQTAAHYYGLEHIDSFSGGTEATASNIRAMKALRRAGFEIKFPAENIRNGKYEVCPGKSYKPEYLYSKVYGDKVNPQEKFAAVMVCSDADEACPVVFGAEERISLPFDDPRHSDDTPSETAKYDEACRLIAIEMFFVMRKIK